MAKKEANSAREIMTGTSRSTSNDLGLTDIRHRLGLSLTQTQRRVSQSNFPKPFLNEKGQRRWTVQQIDEVLLGKATAITRKIEKRAGAARVTPNHGALFAKAIGFLKARPFDPQNTPIDLAEHLAADAATVKTILTEWADLRGGWFILTTNDIETINGLPLEGSWPVHSVEELISNLKESAEALQMGSAPQKKTG